MHPEFAELFSGGGFALGDLAFMMGEDVVLAASVDIDGVAEKARRHGAAFDMPAGVSFAPRGGPAHDVGGVRFPEEEVGGIFFAGGFGGAAAGAVGELFDGVSGEFSIGGEAADAVIDDTVGADVSVAVGDEGLDHVDEGRDEVGGAGHEFDLIGLCGVVALQNDGELQGAGVFEEAVNEELGDFARVVGIRYRPFIYPSRFFRFL